MQATFGESAIFYYQTCSNNFGGQTSVEHMLWRLTDHPAGRHSVRTNQCPPPPSSPFFFTGRMPFLPPNQQCQSTEGNGLPRLNLRDIVEKVFGKPIDGQRGDRTWCLYWPPAESTRSRSVRLHKTGEQSAAALPVWQLECDQ